MQQKKEQTLRREQLLLDHPAVVNQFMLLLGAGLSVRKVIERLVSEYEKKCQRGGKKGMCMRNLVLRCVRCTMAYRRRKQWSVLADAVCYSSICDFVL